LVRFRDFFSSATSLFFVKESTSVTEPQAGTGGGVRTFAARQVPERSRIANVHVLDWYLSISLFADLSEGYRASTPSISAMY
jgi:hypothetical protein